MSRKDFEALARMIVLISAKHRLSYAVQTSLALETSDICARANSDFDRARFLRACHVDISSTAILPK